MGVAALAVVVVMLGGADGYATEHGADEVALQLQLGQLHDGAASLAHLEAEVLVRALLPVGDGIDLRLGGVGSRQGVVAVGGRVAAVNLGPFVALVRLGLQRPFLRVAAGIVLCVVACGQRVACHADGRGSLEHALPGSTGLGAPLGAAVAVHQFVVTLAAVARRAADGGALRSGRPLDNIRCTSY